MIEYLQRLSDTQNISTTIRRKFYRLGRDSLAEMLFETGTLAPSFFERVYDGGWESMAGAFKPTDYDLLVSHVIAEVNQDSFFPTLDLNCANYMIEFLQKAKHISFGIEPVLAFCLAWEQALKAVQTILAGKLFNVPHEKMQQRMRDLYS
jgi:V/A-type H+-transporting ATPase subunit C